MQKLISVLIVAVLMVSLAACGNETAQPSETTSSSSAAESTPEQGVTDNYGPGDVSDMEKVTYTEKDMPQNSPETQAYVDKYMYPFNITRLLDCSYSPDNMSELLDPVPFPPLKSIFNAFYNHDYPDSELRLTDLEIDVPQDIFEGTLMNHLVLTPEQIRQSCAEFYNEEKKVYTAAFGLGGVGGLYVITENNVEGNIHNLAYDVYVPDYDRNIGSTDYYWVLYHQGILQMEINGDSYKYISNTLHNGAGHD